ncbi:MAG: hypothetical protein KF784_10825 [Fimbriimonadaceae bacterium]|nr:hypothetical protein [Fimbriimonadaceae bacterium]
MGRRINYWVYIWMPDRRHFVIDVSDGLYHDAYNRHLQAALDRKTRIGLVYNQVFRSRNKARAEAKRLMALSSEELLDIIKTSNPLLIDQTPSLVAAQAEQDAMVRYGRWTRDDDADAGGGVGARLPQGPRGPRARAFEEPWPPVNESVVTEVHYEDSRLAGV